MLLADIGQPIDSPTTIYVDNSGAIDLAHDYVANDDAATVVPLVPVVAAAETASVAGTATSRGLRPRRNRVAAASTSAKVAAARMVLTRTCARGAGTERSKCAKGDREGASSSPMARTSHRAVDQGALEAYERTETRIELAKLAAPPGSCTRRPPARG